MWHILKIRLTHSFMPQSSLASWLNFYKWSIFKNYFKKTLIRQLDVKLYLTNLSSFLADFKVVSLEEISQYKSIYWTPANKSQPFFKYFPNISFLNHHHEWFKECFFFVIYISYSDTFEKRWNLQNISRICGMGSKEHFLYDTFLRRKRTKCSFSFR